MQEALAQWNNAMPSDTQLLHDAYFGDGGFKDGSYLVPHPRETATKYARRQFMNYYINYVAPALDAHIDPIFKEKPVRQYKNNQLFDAFLEDVDGAGTSLTRFIHQVATRATLYGGALIVLDNFSQQADNMADAVEGRQYPYLYVVSKDNTKSLIYDRFGKLSQVTYKLSYTVIQDDGKGKPCTDTWTWTDKTWERIDGNNKKTTGDNLIGVIPVIPIYGAPSESGNTSGPFPQSRYLQIAKCNLAIYNACSELRERNRSQAFSILGYPVSESDDFDNPNALSIGTDNMVLYRGDAGAPSYIEPGAAPSDILLKEIQYLINEIYRMSDRSNVTGTNQESGIAKEWDNNALFQSIADFANTLALTETKIAKLFGLYVNADLDYYVRYNKDYGVVDVTKEINKATQALMLGIGGDFDTEVKKQAALAMFQDYNDNDLNKILKSIEDAKQQTALAGTEGDV